MRILIVACIFLLAFCEEKRHFHYKEGKLAYNTQLPVVIEGPAIVQDRKTLLIAGMNVGDGTKTPFWFGGSIKRYSDIDGHIEITVAMTNAGWGINEVTIVGNATIIGTWQEATFTSTFTTTDKKDKWVLNAKGTYSKFFSYSLNEAAVRVKALIGESGIAFPAGTVLGYAAFGLPYVKAFNECMWYLYMPNFSPQKPGAAIVGKDGAHCGILSPSGETFIHSNPTTKVVTETPMSMVNAFFRNGYMLKDYSGLL